MPMERKKLKADTERELGMKIWDFLDFCRKCCQKVYKMLSEIYKISKYCRNYKNLGKKYRMLSNSTN
jgi:hypothetical protein